LINKDIQSTELIPERAAVIGRRPFVPLGRKVTMHEDLRDSPRCRVTFDALVKGLQRHVTQ
jgi:hypothetical protein